VVKLLAFFVGERLWLGPQFFLMACLQHKAYAPFSAIPYFYGFPNA